MSGTRTPTATELAYREADGIQVALLWYRHEGLVTVAVNDSRSGTDFEILVDDTDDALDVFNHPFAYAAHSGTLIGTPTEEELSLPV